MSEHKILTNRTINCIKNLRYMLKENDQAELYNDLLILGHIIPSLPTDAIRSLLLELKPHLCESSDLFKPCIDFKKIHMILSKVKTPSQLLTDFLACAGVAPNGKN